MTKTKHLHIRVSEDEMTRISINAAKSGLSITEYIIRLVNDDTSLKRMICSEKTLKEDLIKIANKED